MLERKAGSADHSSRELLGFSVPLFAGTLAGLSHAFLSPVGLPFEIFVSGAIGTIGGGAAGICVNEIMKGVDIAVENTKSLLNNSPFAKGRERIFEVALSRAKAMAATIPLI